MNFCEQTCKNLWVNQRVVKPIKCKFILKVYIIFVQCLFIDIILNLTDIFLNKLFIFFKNSAKSSFKYLLKYFETNN